MTREPSVKRTSFPYTPVIMSRVCNNAQTCISMILNFISYDISCQRTADSNKTNQSQVNKDTF